MKKTVLILLLVLAVSVMVACDSGPGDTSSAVSDSGVTSSDVSNTETVSQDTAAHKATGYIFEYEGTSMGVGDLSETVIEKLGKPADDDIVTTDSCAFNGKDTVYYYPSFEISANDETGSFVIYSIYLKDDTVSTKEGAYVGMTVDEVKAIYGEPSETAESAIYYVNEGMKLGFILKDGTVNAISYYINK